MNKNLTKYQKLVNDVYSKIMPQVGAISINTDKKIKKAAIEVLSKVTEFLEKKED